MQICVSVFFYTPHALNLSVRYDLRIAPLLTGYSRSGSWHPWGDASEHRFFFTDPDKADDLIRTMVNYDDEDPCTRKGYAGRGVDRDRMAHDHWRRWRGLWFVVVAPAEGDALREPFVRYCFLPECVATHPWAVTAAKYTPMGLMTEVPLETVKAGGMVRLALLSRLG